ncbi:hypothetical protein SHKM778_35870 [Streptomyces sp. KM77-8]|uniref:Fibronectin type III-like domain-containing protein n=1 Tax=Streptomyces haneummycinicus TaxID=3074435 RepID=A0AAT9HIF8_9ACTN
MDVRGVERAAVLAGGEDLTVTVRVRNTGERAGREVVQVYLARPPGPVDRPERWLAGYSAVHAGPGRRSRHGYGFRRGHCGTGRWSTTPGRSNRARAGYWRAARRANCR